MLLFKITKALDRHKVPYALVGGYAVALHGVVRGTVDVDLVIQLSKAQFIRTEEAFKSFGLEPRLPVTAEQVFSFRDDYIKNRDLVAWSFFNPRKPIETVDVLITEDLNDIRTVSIKTKQGTLKVASIEDLIRMKKKSGRPQDLADVDALKRIQK